MKGHQKNNRQFAVIGMGHFGQSIVRTLIRRRCEVLACDIDHNVVHDVATYATHVIEADATDEAALDSMGIGNFDVVIIAIGNSFESTLLATMLCKERGAKYLLAKAADQRQAKILRSVGADRVVLPESEMGEKIATSLVSTNIIDFIDLSEDYNIAEIFPLSEWIDKPLKKSNIRFHHNINIVAIKREDEFVISPSADEVITEHDCLIVIGEKEALYRLAQYHH